jgi:putative hydrolase of the HAD superfamily
MYAVSQEYWNLEEDTMPILQWLQDHGFRIGLISNASDLEDVYSLLRKFDLTSCFEHTIISAEFGYRKPHRDIFMEGLQLFQAEPQYCFMVGDRLDMDILGANQMNITSIWITRRSIHKGVEQQFNVRPNYQISTLMEIKEILQSD